MNLRASIAPIPPGASDLAGEAVRRRRRLQQGMRERLDQGGYEEIIPPTFEYAEVFQRAAGEGADISDRLIRFLDLDGRLLALRYDFTASVARLAATKLATRPTPLRVSYAGKVYRQDPTRENGARPREILQAGAELLGEAGVAADVEVIRLALELMRLASVDEYQVNLGHAGALAPALATLGPEARTHARRLIDRKDAAGLAALSPTGALAELPFVLGRREALDRAARLSPDARPAIDRLAAIDAALSEAERRHIVYDFGEVRGLDYYTGIHFEVFSAGAGAAVGAGGRYDDLMGRFGRPLPAVGLALDLDALADASVPATA